MIVTTQHKRLPRRKYRFGGSASTVRSKYRYGGNGILSNLVGRTVLKNTVKNLINSVGKSGLIQKAVETVQDGATKALSSQTQKGIHHLVSKGIGKKRNKEQQNIVKTVTQNLASSIPSISSIECIVRGRGIVYD